MMVSFSSCDECQVTYCILLHISLVVNIYCSDVTLPTADTPTPSSSAAEVGLLTSSSQSFASSPRGVSRSVSKSVSKHNRLHIGVFGWIYTMYQVVCLQVARDTC